MGLYLRFPNPALKQQWDQVGRESPALQAALEVALNARKTLDSALASGDPGLLAQYQQLLGRHPDLARWLSSALHGSSVDPARMRSPQQTGGNFPGRSNLTPSIQRLVAPIHPDALQSTSLLLPAKLRDALGSPRIPADIIRGGLVGTTQRICVPPLAEDVIFESNVDSIELLSSPDSGRTYCIALKTASLEESNLVLLLFDSTTHSLLGIATPDIGQASVGSGAGLTPVRGLSDPGWIAGWGGQKPGEVQGRLQFLRYDSRLRPSWPSSMVVASSAGEYWISKTRQLSTLPSTGVVVRVFGSGIGVIPKIQFLDMKTNANPPTILLDDVAYPPGWKFDDPQVASVWVPGLGDVTTAAWSVRDSTTMVYRIRFRSFLSTGEPLSGVREIVASVPTQGDLSYRFDCASGSIVFGWSNGQSLQYQVWPQLTNGPGTSPPTLIEEGPNCVVQSVTARPVLKGTSTAWDAAFAIGWTRQDSSLGPRPYFPRVGVWSLPGRQILRPPTTISDGSAMGQVLAVELFPWCSPGTGMLGVCWGTNTPDAAATPGRVRRTFIRF